MFCLFVLFVLFFAYIFPFPTVGVSHAVLSQLRVYSVAGNGILLQTCTNVTIQKTEVSGTAQGMNAL